MPQKILVVDDEPEIVMLIETRLKSAGFEVVTAYDGLQAIEKVRSEWPDLIVSDVIMPNMDGVDLFKTLRDEPATSHIPMLILTARGATEEPFKKLGIGGFIAKPFEVDQLMAEVKRLLTITPPEEEVIEHVQTDAPPPKQKPIQSTAKPFDSSTKPNVSQHTVRTFKGFRIGSDMTTILLLFIALTSLVIILFGADTIKGIVEFIMGGEFTGINL